MSSMTNKKVCYNAWVMKELLIIGSGAAGLTASLFASKYKINHALIGEKPGGQIMDATMIENYPGFSLISGSDLMQNMVEQIKQYTPDWRETRVVHIFKTETGFKAELMDGTWVEGKSVLLTMGAKHRALNVPGEDHYVDKGVSYSAVADSEMFAGKVVAVIGGGDSALTSALHLAEICEKVYLIHRREDYRAEPGYISKVATHPKIEEVKNSMVLEVKGEDWVSEILIRTNEDEGPRVWALPVSGLVVTIGLMPAISLAVELGVSLHEGNYLKINANHETSVPGVFAAGDLALMEGSFPFRQIVTSAGAGAKSAASIHKYLKGELPEPYWS